MTNITNLQPNSKPMETEEKSQQIRHYFLLSLISTVCFCPLTGLIALACSLKSSAKKDVGFLDRARVFSRWALIWNGISISIFIFTLLVILFLIHGFYSLVATLRAQIIAIGNVTV